MSVLLWLVFSWMVFGTVIGVLKTAVLLDASQKVGAIVGNSINILACIVIAFAAVAL